MGLYDSYKLSNSTAIPQFEGSAGDDFVKVGEYKQGLYDQTQQSFNDTSNQAGEVSSILPQDQEIVKQLREGTQAKIEGLAKQGNYEDMAPQARQIGQEFANRVHEIQGPQAQAAEFKKSLENKELNLTPEQKEAVYGNALRGYQGLKQNSRGQFVGSFNGKEAAKNIDVNDFVDKALKDVVTQKHGDSYETTQDGGMWIIKNGVKTERVDPTTLTKVLDAAKQNSTEFQAFKEMQGDVATYHASKFTDPSITPDGPIKDAAVKASKQYGIPFSSAYQLVAKQATLSHVDNQASIYGLNKYAKNDKESEMSIKDNPYTLKDHDKSTAGPFMIQGPDNKLTNDEKDYDKLTATVNDSKGKVLNISERISYLNKQLANPNLNKNTRTQMEAELASQNSNKDAIQGQANRAEDIMNYSKDATAQSAGFGYQDYNDFESKNTPVFKQAISQIYPSGIPTNKGKMISTDEIAQAVLDGRLKSKYSTVSGGGIGSASNEIPDGATLTLKDGTTINLPQSAKTSQLMDKVGSIFQSSSSRAQEFETKLRATHADNIKDFAIQSTNIAIPSEDSRARIKDLLISNKDNIRFSHPGQLDKVSAPDNFRVVSIGTARIGKDTKLQVEELDKDNKPTGNTFDATTSNSNISEQLARTFARSNAPEDKEVADMLSQGSGASQLQSMIPGQHLDLKRQIKGEDGNLVNGSIKIIRHADKTISYNLVDKDTGDILKTSDNAGEAGRWTDDINGVDTYSNGRKPVTK